MIDYMGVTGRRWMSTEQTDTPPFLTPLMPPLK